MAQFTSKQRFSIEPGKRMVLMDNGIEARRHHVSVDLRGRDVGMAKHFLERAQIGATIK